MRDSTVRRGIVVLCTMLVLVAGVRMLDATPRQAIADAPVDLSGRWTYSDHVLAGASVQISVAANGGQVTATFVPPITCPDGSQLATLFSGALSGLTLSGDMFNACSKDDQFNQDCGLTAPYVTTFQAQIDLAGNTITGTFFDPGYGAQLQNGHYTGCHPDARFDGHTAFALTRRGCDEQALEAQILRDIQALQQINEFAQQQLDAGMQPALDLIDPSRWLTLRQSDAARSGTIFGFAKLGIVSALKKWAPEVVVPPAEAALAAAGTAETVNQLINGTQSWADGISQANATAGGAAALDEQINTLLDQLDQCRQANGSSAPTSTLLVQARRAPAGRGAAFNTLNAPAQDSIDSGAVRALLASEEQILTLAQGEGGEPPQQQALDSLQAAEASALDAEQQIAAQGVDIPNVSVADFIDAALASGDVDLDLSDDERAAIAQAPGGAALLHSVDAIDQAWSIAQQQLASSQVLDALLAAISYPAQ